jgi:hypothetical protein
VSRSVGIATEGPASEAVIDAICSNLGVHAIVRSAEGKSRLKRDFDKIFRAMGTGISEYILVPDLHPEFDCVDEAAVWTSEIAHRFPRARLCLAIWETEAWLLADPPALSRSVGISIEVPDPEEVGAIAPSKILEEAFRHEKGYRRGLAFNKRSDGARIAAALDLAEASGRSPSLGRFLNIALGKSPRH